jgi:hypothetical protein
MRLDEGAHVLKQGVLRHLVVTATAGGEGNEWCEKEQAKALHGGTPLSWCRKA